MNHPFDPSEYPLPVRDLFSDGRLPELGPGSPNSKAGRTLRALSPQRLFPGKFKDADMAACCLAALWLHHDFLDESHRISQEISTPTGSYWHGIMHRREPDAENAKYWFRRIGHHPVVDTLHSEAPKLGYSYQNPLVFVDLCERVRGSGADEELLARKIQLREWQLLFDWCYRKAISG